MPGHYRPTQPIQVECMSISSLSLSPQNIFFQNLSATKLINLQNLSKQNLSTTKLIKLQNVSNSKLINKIHKSKF